MQLPKVRRKKMKNVLTLVACVVALAAAAGAWQVPPYLTASPSDAAGSAPSSDAVLVNNLITSGGQCTNGLSGCAYHSSWVAFDWTPTTNATVRQITLDYLYNSSPLKNTINFRLYRGNDPGAGSIVASWDVLAANYTETNTGWIAFSRPIYRAVVPIPAQSLTANTRYWFAYTSPNSGSANIVYWCVQATLVGEQVWWYLNGSWGTGLAKGAGGTYDQSFALDTSQTDVAPASFGSIRAIFE
jgi:hypothetical protein